LWCYGAKHTWIGKLTYAGYTFASDENDPLQFVVDKNKGYAYIKGKGAVTLPDGTIVPLPRQSPKSIAPPSDMPTPVPPTSTATPIPPTQALSVIIKLGPGKYGKPLWLEVVKGEYKLVSGATLLAGSATGVYEDWMTFLPGLAIDVEGGEITLKGKTYSQGAELIVDAQGNLMPRVETGPAIAPTPSAFETKDLVISFDPNPVTPDEEGGYWIWRFTFSVYNPNDFPVKVVAFGDFDECLTSISSCAYTSEDFASWFTGCGPGSAFVPANGRSCDKEWWVKRKAAPNDDLVGRYAVYYQDENGETKAAISELLTLRKP
jgi:hypothetical protein